MPFKNIQTELAIYIYGIMGEILTHEEILCTQYLTKE